MLSYFEGYSGDEVPPEEIWHHSQRLEEWFEAIKQRREHGFQPVDDGGAEGMETNSLARELRGA